jgi:hypothetical protein
MRAHFVCPILACVILAACSSLPKQDPHVDMALALVAQQARDETYMTANAYTYRVLIVRPGGDPRALSAAIVGNAAHGSRVRFAGDRTVDHDYDLSRMLIQYPVARIDGGFDVAFSYSTCLRSGGFHAWESLAHLRAVGSQWQVVSVTWTGHAHGRCDARKSERPA